MSITQLLEWLGALLFGRNTPGSRLDTPALLPVPRPQGPPPYAWGARLVDAPRLRAQGVTAPRLVRPLPGPHWALPPANWAAFRPYLRRSDAPPGPVCTCPQYAPRRGARDGAQGGEW